MTLFNNTKNMDGIRAAIFCKCISGFLTLALIIKIKKIMILGTEPKVVESKSFQCTI